MTYHLSYLLKVSPMKSQDFSWKFLCFLLICDMFISQNVFWRLTPGFVGVGHIHIFSMFYWFMLRIENLLTKMYIEVALLSKSCNIALPAHPESAYFLVVHFLSVASSRRLTIHEVKKETKLIRGLECICHANYERTVNL